MPNPPAKKMTHVKLHLADTPEAFVGLSLKAATISIPYIC